MEIINLDQVNNLNYYKSYTKNFKVNMVSNDKILSSYIHLN